jgi:putative inorganic carbon (HCO3(-)) transporter
MSTTSTLEVESLTGRVELWSRALYAIQDFPFTGMGMGTFGYVMPVLYPLFQVSPDVIVLHAHDEFLQVAVDLGLPGLAAFLGIYLIAVWMLIAVWRRDTDSFRRAVALGLLTGVLAHAVFGLTDAVLLTAKPSVFWWALLGLAAGTFLLTDRDKANLKVSLADKDDQKMAANAASVQS